MIEITSGSGADVQSVRLTGNLDVRNANRLHAVLNDLLSQGKPATIECGALESIDTACVQLLLAAKSDPRASVHIAFEANSEVAKWFGYAGVGDRLLASSEGETK